MKAAFVISMIVFYLLGVVANIERVNYIHLRYRLPYLTHLNLLLLCYLSWLIHLPIFLTAMMKIDYSERKQNAIIKMVLYHRYTDNRNEFYNLPFNDKKPVDKVIAAMERKLVLGRTDIKNYLVIDNKTNTIIKKVNLV